MSYDILFFRLREGAPPASSRADFTDERCLPLGSPDELHAQLAALYPEARWSRVREAGPECGQLEVGGERVELQIPRQEPVRYVSVGLSHGADGGEGIVQAICDATGWTGFDGQAERVVVPRGGLAIRQ